MLPQLSFLLNYFIKRNLRVARSRAYDLTVKSRGKPDSFWSKGYVEEWEQPPIIKGLNEPKGTKGKRQEGYLSWILWCPSQMAIRHCESHVVPGEELSMVAQHRYWVWFTVLLIPISPYLPLFNIVFTSATRGLYTARHLHEPYFAAKGMSPLEVELWLEERKWGYRGK